VSLYFAKQTVKFVRQGHPLCKRVGLKVQKRWSNSQDALGQPFLVPLTQPGLRARTKAARNNLAAAREAAEKGAPNPSPVGSRLLHVQCWGATSAQVQSGAAPACCSGLGSRKPFPEHQPVCSTINKRVLNCGATGLLREHHDEVGRFLAALQPEGAAQASLLPGLSLHAELSLAIQRGQFKQCVPRSALGRLLSHFHFDASYSSTPS